jgi:hypothetical protein
LKYIEFGIGNTWLIRTETELEDGTEYEERGVKGSVKYHSIYLRLWLGKFILILDSKEGLKRQYKTQKNIKLIVGIVSKTS